MNSNGNGNGKTHSKATVEHPASLLEARHIEHLLFEGFTDSQILGWQAQGLRSLSETEAEKLGFKVKTESGLKSGAGLYFPFSDDFGQLRLDEPIERESGQLAKYLTPVGAKSKARLPDDCKVVTEGAKDAHAGSVHGNIPTGALAGVSHYRKALKQGAGYTVLFDSDGWFNPSVFSNLFRAGKYLDGEVQLVLEIPGEPKAGLCEYFKAGYTGEDYAALIKAAMKPEALLMAWPQYFGKIRAEKLLAAIKVAFRLGAEYLDEVQLELLLNDIRKATKLSVSLLKEKLNEQIQIVKHKLKRVKRQTGSNDSGSTRTSKVVRLSVKPQQGQPESPHENKCEDTPESTLKDPDWVDTGTVEALIFDTLFEGGNGHWKTIEDSFYQDTGKGYWRKVSDKTVLKAITLKCKAAYKIVQQKNEQKKVYPFGTDPKKQSAFKFCRDGLDAGKDSLSNNHLRCFRNCTIDLRTGQTIPHDPAHFLTTSVAADYQPNQPCPEVFLSFIKSAFGEDLTDPIRAYTSMLLDPTAPYGKFIHLMGPSGSGKGTLLRLWGEMFGLDHFRSGDFQNLSTAEGRHQFLTGASLFAVPDVGGYVQGLKPFYELVDNGPMSGRALFSSTGYQKLWNTRFVIASVDHLQIENAGDGWDRRCLPLPTKTRQGIEDPELGRKLAEVKGQIISWALGMPREERDRLILYPSANEQILALKQDAAIHGDPVRAFVDFCLRPSNSRGRVHSHELHTWFAAFAQEHGYQGWGMSKLINHVKTILPQHYSSRRKVSGALIPAHWINVVARSGAFVDISQEGDDSGSQHKEPIWKCVKSQCQEGGLLAFTEFSKGSGGSPGSPTPDTPREVTDPAEITQNQDFQKSGSPGSPGSDRGGVEFGSQNQNTNSCSTNSATTAFEKSLWDDVDNSPTPPGDPGDPGDPKPETLDTALFTPDQSNEVVADPTDPTDPDISVGAIAPTETQQLAAIDFSLQGPDWVREAAKKFDLDHPDLNESEPATQDSTSLYGGTSTAESCGLKAGDPIYVRYRYDQAEYKGVIIATGKEKKLHIHLDTGLYLGFDQVDILPMPSAADTATSLEPTTEEPSLKVGDRVAGAHRIKNDYYWSGIVVNSLDGQQVAVEWKEGRKIPRGVFQTLASDLRRLD